MLLPLRLQKISACVAVSFFYDDIIVCFPIRNIQEHIRNKAGLVSAMIDALVLCGKCTSGPNEFTTLKVYILV